MFPVLANGQCVVVRVAVMKNQSWTWVGSIVELIFGRIYRVAPKRWQTFCTPYNFIKY